MSKIKSFLFIPANKLHYLFNSNNADALIVDFEDSVDSIEKKTLTENFNKCDLSTIKKKIFVRINNYFYKEIMSDINISKICGVIIPKSTYSNQIIKISEYIHNLNLEQILLIESPDGLLNLNILIEKTSPKAIFFGSEDYCSLMRCKRSELSLLYARQVIVNTARGLNIDSYDTIYPSLSLDKNFYREVDHSQELGFDGKLAIHPSQIDYINTVFDVLPVSLKDMEKVIKEYENNNDIVIFNNQIYEKPHIDFFKKIINEKKDNK